MKNKTLLWLDDIRNPHTPLFILQYAPEYYYNDTGEYETVWVKSYDEFVDWISENGLPDEIGFDHDLGSDKSGMDAAKWLVDYCIDNESPLPHYFIQSANIVGRKNIDGLLSNFKNFHTT